MILYGKKAPVARLAAFRRSGRFPHALMFCGEKGVGRSTLADYAAALMLCEKGGEEPCGGCVHCRKVFSHIHPDVVYPLREAEKGKYTVDQLRALIADCCKAPNDGSLRVCVFENADEMSVLCQNTLLKFIEEPLSFNRCVFTVQRKSAVLETVRSRVVFVDVGAAGRGECLSALAEKGIAPEKAEELYGLFGGNIGKCLEAAENTETAVIFGIAADIADAVCAGREYDCAVSFSALKTREDIKQALTLLSACFAGAAAALSKSGENVGGALSEQAARLAGKLRIKTVAELYDATQELSDGLEYNPNVALFTAHCCEKLFSVLENGM